MSYRRTMAATVCAALAGTQVVADRIIFQSDDDIMVIRIDQRLDDTLVELLANDDGSILCIAVDEADQPLATTTGYAQQGSVSFRNLDAEGVTEVQCRYN